MVKNAVRTVCFFVVLVILLHTWHSVFRFKYYDGIYSMAEFYGEEKDSIDVVFLGSSHVYCNVNPNILWKEYGIAGYDLAGCLQPLWNSYYYMKEALKTQKPSLLVVDCFTAVYSWDYVDESKIIKNNYGLRFSEDKINSVMASAPRDTWAGYLLEYPTYHGRYTDITRDDFTVYHKDAFTNYKVWKGLYTDWTVNPQNRPVVETMEGSRELDGKHETYLRKIIELAQEEGIALVLMVAPYVVEEHDMQIFRSVSEIADEYGVDFIDFNYCYDAMGLDFSSDYMDVWHLNCFGSEKFTRYLADYLKSRFGLPDHRGDERYGSYDEMVRYYGQYVYNHELRDITDFQDYMLKLRNGNYITVFTLLGNDKSLSNYEEIKSGLLHHGIHVEEAGENAVWVVQDGNVIYTTCGSEESFWYQEIGSHDTLTVQYTVGAVAAAPVIPKVLINAAAYASVGNGLNVLTYDMLGETLVECKGFAANGNEISLVKQ